MIYVDPAGGGDYTAIKPAVLAAVTGDTVLIAAGYYEGSQNLEMDLADKNLVIVAPAGPDLTEIYSGGQGRMFTIAGGQDSTCVIEGLKISHGSESVGGGVYCFQSSPVFRNCFFNRCFIHAGSTIECKGGAAYCEDASPLFEDCTFWRCHVGGEHWEEGQGGAVYAVDSSPTFLGCDFQDCATYGGEGHAFYSLNSTSHFESCQFISNSSDANYRGYGGGAYITGGSVTFRSVRFVQNRSYLGGGVRFVSSSAAFEDVEFHGNSGSLNGGGVSIDGGGPYTFNGVTFSDNYSHWDEGGAGLCFVGASGSVDGCTFYRNDSPLGACISADSLSQLSVVRTILAFSESGPPVDCLGGTPMSVTHCLVYGNTVGDTLCGDYYDNMYERPFFCAAGDEDFTLFSHSPCLPENNDWGELVGAEGQGCVYTGPPDPPTGLALSTDDQTCYVSWDPNSGEYFDHYRVERDTSAAFGAGMAATTTVLTSLVDSPLENGREYFYRVFAADTLGGLSEPSDTASIVVHPTPPGAPTGLAVVGVADRTVDLDWLPVVGSDVTHYGVYRDTEPDVSEDDLYTVTAASSLTDTAAANYTSHYYRVSAVDTGGLVSELSAEVRGVAHGRPPAVSGLAAYPGISSAVLEWDQPEPACQLHYNVYRDTVPDMYSQVVFSDGFETYEPGLPPPSPPWSTVAQTGTAVRVTDAFAASGSRSLAVVDSTPGYCRTFRGLEDTTSASPHLSFSVLPAVPGAEENLVQCELIGERGMGYPVVMLEVSDDSLRHWVSGSDPVALAYCEPGQWHTVGCSIDCVADMYDVWLDAELVATGAAPFNDARYLDIIQLRTRGGESGRAWLDDILWRDLVDVLSSPGGTMFTDEPLEDGTTYYYAVSVVDTFGIEGRRSDVVSVTPGWVGVDVDTAPAAASLALAGPNPSSSGIALTYSVPEPGAPVSIRIYDVSGRLVRTLVDTHVQPGVHPATWDGLTDDGGPVASGVYLCRATVGGWTGTTKLALIR